MDFLEELFKLGKRKYQKNSGVFHDKDHKDEDHDDDDDHYKRRQYPTSPFTQVPAYHPQAHPSSVILLSSIICRRCSTQTVHGAKFCQGCGTAIELILKCASCGSKLPVNEPLCSQCGYRN